MKQFIEVGEIVTVHGVQGELKVYPWVDDIEVFKTFKVLYLSKTGGEEYVPVSIRVQKNMILVKLQGITSAEEAHPLIKKIFYVNRAQIKLPKGRYFMQDIIGLSVVDAKTKQTYGVITNITNNGATDIYHIQNESGQLYLFPAAPVFLQDFFLEEGYVTVNPIEGMFENAN